MRNIEAGALRFERKHFRQIIEGKISDDLENHFAILLAFDHSKIAHCFVSFLVPRIRSFADSSNGRRLSIVFAFLPFLLELGKVIDEIIEKGFFVGKESVHMRPHAR